MSSGSNADGTMTPKELALAVGELLRSLQVPRSIGSTIGPLSVCPGVIEAFDKLHSDLKFGYPTAEEYAKEIEQRFGIG